MHSRFQLALAAGTVLGVALVALVARADQQHDPGMHRQHQAAPTLEDGREIVRFPEEIRLHTLANMRDHLLALQQIQDALAKEQFDQAGDISEQRLGMSSLALHGAHESSRYMPKGMQNVGSEMHRLASRFAVAAKDAGATGDIKPALAALARVTQQCVACHAPYRVQ